MADFNYSDLSQYLGTPNSPFQGQGNFNLGGETEEERRKRLEREQAQIANTEVQTQQVKTYADGSQEHTTTQQVPAPVTPVMPQQAPPPVVQNPPMPVQQAPVQPVVPQQAPVQQSLTPNEQIVPQQIPMPPQAPVAAPINPEAPQPPLNTTGLNAPQLQTGTGPTQIPTGIPNPPVTTSTPNTFNKTYDLLSEPHPDKLAIGQVAYGDYPPHVRQAAETKLEEVKRYDAGMKEGQALQAGVIAGDPKAVRQFQKEISNPNEGSWGKLILAGLLGNKEAQTAEFAKLGVGSTSHPYTAEDGKEYMVTMDAKGRPVSGVNAEGKGLDANELSNLNAGNLKTLRTQANHAANTVMERMQKENDEQASYNRLYKTKTPLPHSAEAIQSAGSNAYQRTMGVGRGGVATTQPTTEPTTQPTTTPGGAQGFERSVNRTMKYEGGYVENDGGRGPTNFGINATANPNVDIKNLTKDQAKQIYKDKYWNGVKGIENLSPAGQDLIFDASVNQGVDYANKLLAKVGDNPAAIVAAREADYRALIERDPSKKQYAENWIRRLEKELHAEGGGETTPAKEISMAEKIANYEMKPPVSRSKGYAVLMNEVSRINPDYDETKYPTIQDARKKFTTGKQGDTVRSMNVAIDHLDTLKEAGDALRNGNLPLFNKIANDFSKNTGSELVTNFDGVKSIVGSEVAKAVSGSQMALADREEIRKELAAANSPQQLNGVIKRFQQLLGGQLKGLRTQYEEAGLKDFDKKLTPRTKQVLEGGNNESKTTRSNW